MAPIASKEAPAQYKQPSRKGKKAWRKHVDVSEVQAGLEEAREEVTKGGRLVDKSSDSLFALDTTGSPTIQASVRKIYKPLKSDDILNQRSAVPSISTHKRFGEVTDGLIEPSTKRRRTSGVNHKEYERLRQVAYGRQALVNVVKKDRDGPSHDPWHEANTEDVEDSRFSFLPKEKPTQAPVTLKEGPKPLIAAAKEVPAVARPAAGISYNPTFQDYDALISSEGQKELEAEKKRLAQAETEQDLLERLRIAEKEAGREAAWQTEDESAWEGIESDYEKPEWLAKKRPERKTPQERKKIERKKERERQEKIGRKAKEREKREKRIAELKSEVEKEAKARKQKHLTLVQSVADEEEVDCSALRRRALRKDKIPEKGLELVLPEELQDSLRRLKPEGNLLKDRYRSMLLSGKVEARKPVSQPKKKRTKATEKWSHKDFSVPVST